MKFSTLLLTFFSLIIIVMLSYSNVQASGISIDNTIVMMQDTTPPPTATPTTTMAPDTMPKTTAEAKPEKEKKEGFNSKTRFGIRAGGVISKQDYESSTPTEDPEGKVGLDLGLLCTIPIGGGFFALQPELHWVQKGYKTPNAVGGELTLNLDYFEIPLLARVNFGGSLKIFAFAGPSFGWLLDGSFDPDNGQDPTDYFKETETSGVVGLGVGIGTFEVDLRYVAGLSDVSDTQNFKDAKNSSFGAGISLKF